MPGGAKACIPSASHHSVRVGAALCDKVVYERSDIRSGAVELERGLAQNFKRRVDSRNKTLRGGLLIAAGAVELTRAEKPVEVDELKAALERKRIYAVILYRIGGAHDLAVLEAGDRVQELQLHILG